MNDVTDEGSSNSVLDLFSIYCAFFGVIFFISIFYEVVVVVFCIFYDIRSKVRTLSEIL